MKKFINWVNNLKPIVLYCIVFGLCLLTFCSIRNLRILQRDILDLRTDYKYNIERIDNSLYRIDSNIGLIKDFVVTREQGVNYGDIIVNRQEDKTKTKIR